MLSFSLKFAARVAKVRVRALQLELRHWGRARAPEWRSPERRILPRWPRIVVGVMSQLERGGCECGGWSVYSSKAPQSLRVEHG